MPNRAIVVLFLGLAPLHVANAQQSPKGGVPTAASLPTVACTDSPVPQLRGALCAQIAAASRLRGDRHPASTKGRAGSGGAGKGALVGLGTGLVPGLLAALIVAPGCEENQEKCGAGFIVLGAALGAGIGAVVGAAVGD